MKYPNRWTPLALMLPLTILIASCQSPLIGKVQIGSETGPAIQVGSALPNPPPQPAIITSTGCAWAGWVHPKVEVKGRWTPDEINQDDKLKKTFQKNCPAAAPATGFNMLFGSH